MNNIPKPFCSNLVSRMQTTEPINTPGLPRPSIVSVIRATVAESGIRSLYTGLTASVTRQMTYSLVRLGSYEEIKRRIAKDRSPTTGELLIAACIAGALGGIAGNPAGEQILLILL
jgi:solute carrier family 25 (mitochondrial dicarboxylate transporter), member 10